MKYCSRDFYGSHYWYEHQVNELGLPDITVRSRSDLPERCVCWLRAVMKYHLPPAHVLELGSSHGGFVAMLRVAGYEAMGLETQPSNCRLRTQDFQRSSPSRVT